MHPPCGDVPLSALVAPDAGVIQRLPLIIFAILKSKLPRLVLHFLFAQRFCITPSGVANGEVFCFVDLMAIAGFSRTSIWRPLSEATVESDLTPIPLACNS
ncbi:hypothetical protein B0H11DRAFT_2251421 [Mycena galericulata]|nr:hypothetical protein B0H11DRAFT_2251421 [Mycena galericulata]